MVGSWVGGLVGPWSVVCGLWLVVCGWWLAVCGAVGLWPMVYGLSIRESQHRTLRHRLSTLNSSLQSSPCPLATRHLPPATRRWRPATGPYYYSSPVLQEPPPIAWFVVRFLAPSVLRTSLTSVSINKVTAQHYAGAINIEQHLRFALAVSPNKFKPATQVRLPGRLCLFDVIEAGSCRQEYSCPNIPAFF